MKAEKTGKKARGNGMHLAPGRLVNITDGNTIRRLPWTEAEKIVHPQNPTFSNPSGIWNFCPKKGAQNG